MAVERNESGSDQLKDAAAGLFTKEDLELAIEKGRQARNLEVAEAIVKDDNLLEVLKRPSVQDFLDDLGVYDKHPLKGILVLSKGTSSIAIMENGVYLLIKNQRRPKVIDTKISMLLLADYDPGEVVRDIGGRTYPNPFNQGQILGDIKEKEFRAAIDNACATIAKKIQAYIG